MDISVCMIVKDEELVLKRCLDCVKQFADEIIIIDTGSRDKTKQIAKHYTEKIYDFVWINDFSKARNYSFSFATKDFVMWLDADDIVNSENIKKINNLKSRPALFDTYMFKYSVSFFNDGKPAFTFYRERLIRRNFNAQWQGFIHEAIPPVGKTKFEDITIEHRKEKNEKINRNLKIYQFHKRNGANFNSREQYYYSKELYYNGYYKSSILELNKYLKMPAHYQPNLDDALLTLMRCYIAINRPEKAYEIGVFSLSKINLSSEYCCCIAESLLMIDKLSTAIFFYEAALNIEYYLNDGSFKDKSYYHLFPLLQLSSLYYRLGNYDKAKKYHLVLKRDYPNNDNVLNNEQFFKD